MMGGHSYDRFRNLLTIPILHAKSRVIAFGARVLDPEAEPEYLNSPETGLFDKGSTLFTLPAPGNRPSNAASSSWSKAIWT